MTNDKKMANTIFVMRHSFRLALTSRVSLMRVVLASENLRIGEAFNSPPPVLVIPESHWLGTLSLSGVGAVIMSLLVMAPLVIVAICDVDCIGWTAFERCLLVSLIPMCLDGARRLFGMAFCLLACFLIRSSDLYTELRRKMAFRKMSFIVVSLETV